MGYSVKEAARDGTGEYECPYQIWIGGFREMLLVASLVVFAHENICLQCWCPMVV